MRHCSPDAAFWPPRQCRLVLRVGKAPVCSQGPWKLGCPVGAWTLGCLCLSISAPRPELEDCGCRVVLQGSCAGVSCVSGQCSPLHCCWVQGSGPGPRAHRMARQDGLSPHSPLVTSQRSGALAADPGFPLWPAFPRKPHCVPHHHHQELQCVFCTAGILLYAHTEKHSTWHTHTSDTCMLGMWKNGCLHSTT